MDALASNLLEEGKKNKEWKKEIDKNLNFYFKNIDLSKIVPIPGDLTKLDIGIDPDIRIDILKKVDLIIHAAADVSHVGSYEKYHNINVLGTKNLLKFIMPT